MGVTVIWTRYDEGTESAEVATSGIQRENHVRKGLPIVWLLVESSVRTGAGTAREFGRIYVC
jgi:hypothetical protein